MAESAPPTVLAAHDYPRSRATLRAIRQRLGRCSSRPTKNLVGASPQLLRGDHWLILTATHMYMASVRTQTLIEIPRAACIFCSSLDEASPVTELGQV